MKFESNNSDFWKSGYPDGFKIEETKLGQNNSNDTIINYSDLVNNGLRR